MKRYYGLLLPVQMALAGLAVLFCLTARELQTTLAAELTITTQQGKTQDFVPQAFSAEIYLPILLKERQPASLIEAITTTQGYNISNLPPWYFTYGYVRNLTTVPLYDVSIHFEVTWHHYSGPPVTELYNVTPALTATLPGQLNPFYISLPEYQGGYPSIGPVVGISASPWVSGNPYYPLTITDYEHADSTVYGTVRNDSGKPLQHARVVGLLPEPQLDDIVGYRSCGPREAALGTDILLRGQETSFTISYSGCNVDDSLIVVGQGAYLP